MKKAVLVVAMMSVASFAQANEAFKVAQQAINQTGNSCHQVTQVFFSGETKEAKMYSVACSGGQTYMISAKRDGSGSVASCNVLEKVGLKCFRKI